MMLLFYSYKTITTNFALFLSALKELKIVVKDINDELPSFSESIYSEVVSMTEKPGHTLLNVSSNKCTCLTCNSVSYGQDNINIKEYIFYLVRGNPARHKA